MRGHLARLEGSCVASGEQLLVAPPRTNPSLRRFGPVTFLSRTGPTLPPAQEPRCPRYPLPPFTPSSSASPSSAGARRARAPDRSAPAPDRRGRGGPLSFAFAGCRVRCRLDAEQARLEVEEIEVAPRRSWLGRLGRARGSPTPPRRELGLELLQHPLGEVQGDVPALACGARSRGSPRGRSAPPPRPASARPSRRRAGPPPQLQAEPEFGGGAVTSTPIASTARKRVRAHLAHARAHERRHPPPARAGR